MRFRLTPGKSDDVIVSEWDALSSKRFRQINSGSDLTYNHVLVPGILNLIENLHYRNILDAGCGTGMLTRLLAQRCDHITGIDPSEKSIQYAQSINDFQAAFLPQSLEYFSAHNNSKFDAVVANMVLMDTKNLDSFLFCVSNLLERQGVFVFSITHPMFWPSYFGYQSEHWFKYQDEIVIEAPFRTSLDTSGDLVSTHIHRPLSMYFESLKTHGFILDAIAEPMPSAQLERLYPTKWQFPHYLLARCVMRH